ncbi:MAG: ribonuclease J [Candidatus Dormibacter sp.]|uniref:ribonuclease J n=1 Tax=Candidatus Dormibacter sp. TaxID=2973982 RepID=UPI0026782C14
MPALKYVPLGGLGEVGLNMWALEWERELVVIDAGLMFGQDEMPGVDLVLPDPSYLLQAGRKVHGIFLSHGHEDHIGGLPFLLKRLNVPVFGTPLTLGLARSRLREHRILRESDLREVRLGDRVRLGPFSIETVAVSHSIPDAAALIIETPIGRLLYTSDFKLEADPPYGRATDLERFRRLGEQGVLLMLSDSTNAEREGHSGSERDLVPEFERIFTEAPGRIVVASFASNIHRIQLAVRLAAEHGRRVAVAGRSLRNAFQVARELGYLEVPENLTVKLEKAGDDPRLVLLTAGSQGEPLSALARFAAQKHPVVNVRAGDWVILSARPIPGNERLVNRTINNLYRNGAERVFYSELGHVHVSGHAYRDELRQLIELVRPRFFVPVHGEYRQLHHHAELAVAAGIPKERVFLAEDGNVIEVTPEGLKKTADNVSGLVYVDGLGIGDVGQAVLRDRQHLAADGLVVATVGVDRDTGAIRLGPEVTSRGFIASGAEADLQEEATRAVAAAVARAGRRPDRSLLQEAVHDAVSQLLWKKTGRRPMVVPLVTEV